MNSLQLAQAGGGMDILSVFPLLLIFVIFYFLLIRPQQKRAREHMEMVSAVKRGDTVVTGGGIVGKVTRVGPEGEVRVEIADGVQVRVVKSTLSDVRGKAEPVRDKGKEPIAANDDGGKPDA